MTCTGYLMLCPALSGVQQRFLLNVLKTKTTAHSYGDQRSVWRAYSSDVWANASPDAPPSPPSESVSSLLGERARKAQADKEFFTNVLSSAATRRDAKAYIARLRNSPALQPRSDSGRKSEAVSLVNLGSLFTPPRSIDASPKFSQHRLNEQKIQEQEKLHVALVKIRDVSSMLDSTIRGIAHTLSQLAALGMIPCVVVDAAGSQSIRTKAHLMDQAEQLAIAFESSGDHGANVIDSAYTISQSGQSSLATKRPLLRCLREGRVAIVVPIAYAECNQTIQPIAANDAMVALANACVDPHAQRGAPANASRSPAPTLDHVQFSVERVIVIDQAGGISNASSMDGGHVFVNLIQEYSVIAQQLSQSPDLKNSSLQRSNLDLLKQLLEMLPPSSSGLMTTPADVANLIHSGPSTSAPTVGTRRQKNMLIYNLLTDKPAISSSLPTSRLHRVRSGESNVSIPTFVKLGMPVNIFPDVSNQRWTPTSPRIKLTDTSIDLGKLVHLINDSFNRELDLDAYLNRVNDNIAGVIIAGDYEGGAILTWEVPPGTSPANTSRLVPYLDKFAVLKRSQGSGGVADIVFNAMVRSCFPSGVCWRSRKGNPVNKWYFERSRGTWKIPDMNWTMFWTTPDVMQNTQPFSDYESVCRGVIPTWKDVEKAAD